MIIAMICALGVTACSATGGNGPSASVSNEMRSVAVLTEVPGGICLKSRTECLLDIPQSELTWVQTGRGYETTVKLPAGLFYENNWLALVHGDGHGASEWGSNEINYLRRNDVTASDPACLGGKAWCATRDL